MAYLSYIIENYESLLGIVAFVHSHRDGYPRAWHTDNEHYSDPKALKRLNLGCVPQRGYASLRYK